MINEPLVVSHYQIDSPNSVQEVEQGKRIKKALVEASIRRIEQRIADNERQMQEDKLKFQELDNKLDELLESCDEIDESKRKFLAKYKNHDKSR